jgi:DNA-binding Lrp family transcriptional regulator
MPEVPELYNVTGPEDFFVQVAVADSVHLQRLIIDHLATRPEVRHAPTDLIFDRPAHRPGSTPAR